jgi:hypothetical protein
LDPQPCRWTQLKPMQSGSKILEHIPVLKKRKPKYSEGQIIAACLSLAAMLARCAGRGAWTLNPPSWNIGSVMNQCMNNGQPISWDKKSSRFSWKREITNIMYQTFREFSI